MKRKIYYSLTFLVLNACVFTAFAQQDAQYSHFMFNGLAFNPAVAGSKESISALALYRTQWVGWEDAPKTQTLSIHAPLRNIKSGVGIHLINDELGQESNLEVSLSYAYKLELGNGVLSAGLNLGFYQQALDGTKLKPEDQTDGAIPKTKANDIAGDIGLGLYYSTENFYAGISSRHINQPKIAYDAGATGKSFTVVRHHYLTAGYTYNLSPKFDIKPSVLLKLDKLNNAPQPEVNVNVFYNQKMWAGISYRHADALLPLVGFNLTDKIRLSYSYDVTLTPIAGYSGGSHEIMLGYDFFLVSKAKTDIIIKTPRFL